MSVQRFLIHDVVVVEPGTTTDRTDTVLDYSGGAVTRTPEKWWVAQQSTADARDTQTGQVTTWLGTAPADSTVTASSRVEYGGETLEVVGDPLVAHTPDGVHHIEVQLRRVAG